MLLQAFTRRALTDNDGIDPKTEALRVVEVFYSIAHWF